MTRRLSQPRLLEGVRALADRDRDLARVVARFGPPPLWARPPGFATLLRIILEQQVSLRSAEAAYGRLVEATGDPTPEGLLALSDDALKRIGFSRQKTRYGRELARLVAGGELDLSQLARRDDRAARETLMRVTGIGPWTADIYLLMALRRPDVWPAGDLALQVAAQELKRLPARPATDELEEIGRAWRPWRAVAARLLWHFYLSTRNGS